MAFACRLACTVIAWRSKRISSRQRLPASKTCASAWLPPGWMSRNLCSTRWLRREVVLTETERQMGVVVCDVGGGTTDMAIYVDGDVWHTAVLAIGGNHITSDIAQVLHLPNSQAEEIKLQHGHADPEEIDPNQYFQHPPVWRTGGGAGQPSGAGARSSMHAVEEIFGMVVQEIKRSGYDGLLPAGMVLTGGTSAVARHPFGRQQCAGAAGAQLPNRKTCWA